MELNNKQIRKLKKEAHTLVPSVILGKNGPTESLIKELTAVLEAKELIKLKFQGFKEVKRQVANDIAKTTDSNLITVVGNIAILYKQSTDPTNRKYL